MAFGISATSEAEEENEQSTKLPLGYVVGITVEGAIPAHAADKLENGPQSAKSTSIGTPAVVFWLIVIDIGPDVATLRYIHIGFGVEYKQLYCPAPVTPVVLQ
jgi:hypothetical protein